MSSPLHEVIEGVVNPYRDATPGVELLTDLDPAVAPKVADRIFRLYLSLSTKPTGAGLRLAIVARIVRDHGGSLYVGPIDPTCARFTLALLLG